jgi:hypothetical protein
LTPPTTSTDSHDSLQELVHVLNHGERESLSNYINGKNDILARLPTELVVEIFRYLDIFDTWRLQLVNRQWRRILSSRQLLETAVTRWNTHSPDDAGLPPYVVHDTFDEAFQHLLAVSQGKPCSQLTLLTSRNNWEPRFIGFSQCSMFDFKGSKIVYNVSDGADAVVVRDLITGASSTLHGEAREKIMLVVLTIDLVAFLNYDGILYVFNLDDPSMNRRTRVQLPSAAVVTHGSDAGFIAFATGVDETFRITLYDAQEQRASLIDPVPALRSLRCNEQLLDCVSLIVDSTLRVIDILVLDFPAKVSQDDIEFHVQHVRMSFDSELICSQNHRQLAPLSEDDYYVLSRPRPSGYRNVYHIQIAGKKQPHELRYYQLVLDLYFNTHMMALTQSSTRKKRHHRITGAGYSKIHTQPFDNRPYPEWKGMSFEPWDAEADEWDEVCTVMNETFLVTAETPRRGRTGRIKVFCFDPRVNMCGADESTLTTKH